jgi:hypothetical protein
MPGRVSQNPAMHRFLRFLIIAAAAFLLVLGLAGAGLYHWIGQSDFRERVEQQASAALGVPLKLGAIRIDWFPVPAVALDDVALQTLPPITAKTIEARPVWMALLERRLEVATLVVRGGAVPQAGVDALLATLQRRKPGAADAKKAEVQSQAGMAAGAMLWIPRRTVIDELSWISAKGVTSVIDARASLGDDGLPEAATVKLRKGPLEGTQVDIQRDDAATPARDGTRWLVDAKVGGGTIKGRVALKAPATPGREIMLSGELQTRGVEVSALTAPNRPLSGKLEASTALNARAGAASGLVDAMQTNTSFTISNAVFHGVDLVKAVSTIGLSRGGETALSQLSGQLTTQGRAAQLTKLVARSGVLAVQGDVSVSTAQALSGRLLVDLTAGKAGNLTGIPLVVGGTLASPEVSLSRSAMLGAALGTAVMPGVGTGAGARLGDKIGQGLSGLFGGGKK